jgi:hypothetical protein
VSNLAVFVAGELSTLPRHKTAIHLRDLSQSMKYAQHDRLISPSVNVMARWKSGKMETGQNYAVSGSAAALFFHTALK